MSGPIRPRGTGHTIAFLPEWARCRRPGSIVTAMRHFPSLVLLAQISVGLLSVSAPAQVPSPGLKLWLRADAGVSTTGDLVDVWTDQSAAGYTLTATGAARPVLSSGSGATVLRFQGGQMLQGNLPFTLQTATIFALFRHRIATSDNDYLYAFGASGSSGSQMTLSRRNGLASYHYDGSRVNTGAPINSGPWLVSTQVYGDGAPGNHALSIDGVTLLTSTSSGYAANFATTRIGDWSGCCFRFWGDLAELIVYDRVVAGAERTQIESYLATKADTGSVVSTGAGCPGTAGPVVLQAVGSSRPIPGQSFSTETIQIPTSAPVVQFIGFDDTRLGSTALPLPLDGIGMTGCSLYISTDIAVTIGAVGGVATWSVTIPNVPAMVRGLFHLQSLVLDPLANGFGFTSSNQLSATIGN